MQRAGVARDVGRNPLRPQRVRKAPLLTHGAGVFELCGCCRNASRSLSALDFRYRASALPVGTLDDLETPIGQFADFAPSDARLEVIPQGQARCLVEIIDEAEHQRGLTHARPSLRRPFPSFLCSLLALICTALSPVGFRCESPSG
jgi:hypothetical protein